VQNLLLVGIPPSNWSTPEGTALQKTQLDLTEAREVTEALLAVLGLPSYYLFTTLATLGGLTNFVTGLNLASGNIYKGNWGAVPDNLKKAWDDEVAAVKAVLNLPKTLVEETKFRLGNLVPDPALMEVDTKVSKESSDATKVGDGTGALLAVLGLPSYYLFTTLATLGGLTNFVTGLNLASGNIYKGNWDDVPDNLKKAWDDEVAAVKAVLNLPNTLVEETKVRLGNLAPASAANLEPDGLSIETLRVTTTDDETSKIVGKGTMVKLQPKTGEHVDGSEPLPGITDAKTGDDTGGDEAAKIGDNTGGDEAAKIGDNTGDNQIRDNIKNIRGNIKKEIDNIRGNIKKEIDKRTEANDEDQTRGVGQDDGVNPPGGRDRKHEGGTAPSSSASGDDHNVAA
jgi:hypothetical protein